MYCVDLLAVALPPPTSTEWGKYLRYLNLRFAFDSRRKKRTCFPGNLDFTVESSYLGNFKLTTKYQIVPGMFCYMIRFILKLSISSSDYKGLYFILHEEHIARGDTLFLRTIFGLALLWSC